ncbi:MAG: hypothetical protein EZS28_007314 [Streblomastix strix]|uniref:Uncharacterized protein n=1 Tax=Streblomastix strix TaxID=222440 RepID=A0A5J4WQW1_9EUKA|nr:MAG: hypothetical protein EZS28_007314 [Streblomastix strix]
MVREHDILRVASLDSLQRYYRFPAHHHRARRPVSMTRTQVFTHCRKRNAIVQKGPFLSLRAALVAQGPVDIIEYIQRGASAGDIVFPTRIQVYLVALDLQEETDTIIDITTTNTIKWTANIGKK